MIKKASPEIVLLIIAIGLFFVLLAVPGFQNPSGKEKTVIILMDGLRWDLVLDNLDELPNFKYLVDNGVYGKLKPVSPTFSVANHPAFFSSKKSDKLDWYYAFIFNASGEWDCSKAFMGELPPIITDTDMLSISSSQGKRVTKVITPKGEGLDRNIAYTALRNNDVIYIYDTGPDLFGHETNLTDKSNALPYIKLSDNLLGIALDVLRSQGMLEKTNIIVFGDHGMAAIDKFPKWRLILQDLKKLGITEENTCYWNDAGVSVRFWFRNGSVQQQIEPRIKDYFMNSVADRECFFVPDAEYLRSHNVLHPDSVKKRTSLGDLIIGLNVGCKLIYEGAIPSFLSGFEDKLKGVDKFASMHGYLDNEHTEVLAFVGMMGPVFKKNVRTELDMVDVAPTLMCGIGYKNEDYYNSIDGRARCDVVKECRC